VRTYRIAMIREPTVHIFSNIGTTEIAEFDSPFTIQKYILWFDIPMSYTRLMKVLDCIDKLGCVVSGAV